MNKEKNIPQTPGRSWGNSVTHGRRHASDSRDGAAHSDKRLKQEKQSNRPNGVPPSKGQAQGSGENMPNQKNRDKLQPLTIHRIKMRIV
jgi:hypothetical protein